MILWRIPAVPPGLTRAAHLLLNNRVSFSALEYGRSATTPQMQLLSLPAAAAAQTHAFQIIAMETKPCAGERELRSLASALPAILVQAPLGHVLTLTSALRAATRAPPRKHVSTTTCTPIPGSGSNALTSS